MNVEDLIKELETPSSIQPAPESFSLEGVDDTKIVTETISITQTKGGVSAPMRLDQKVVDRFNKLIDISAAKKRISESKTVDRSYALEVFTMLDLESKTEAAKLSTVPSEGNKTIVEAQISKIDTSIPEEILEVLRGIYNFKDSNMGDVEDTCKSAAVYTTMLDAEIKRLTDNPPVIVDPNTKTNIYLLTDPVEKFLYIDSDKLMYAKYADGALTQKLKTLFKTEALETICLGKNTDKRLLGCSLQEIAALVKNAIYGLTVVAGNVGSVLLGGVDGTPENGSGQENVLGLNRLFEEEHELSDEDRAKLSAKAIEFIDDYSSMCEANERIKFLLEEENKEVSLLAILKFID